MAHPLPDDSTTALPDIATALDEAAVLAELLWLIFLAGEGMSSRDGGAIARAGLIGVDRLTTLQSALRRIEGTGPG
ncbi:hypothetical protein [Paracoccus sp. Ld10]|uniref:hypothetical protein n=1 Tax=Paracoccus sp. Ld10 TaxID=649158 RepID=UPI00386AAC40